MGVLGNLRPIASLPGQIVVTRNEWYDFEAKYDEGEMELVVPAPISEEQLERVQQLAVEAFAATDCEGMARADMFVREDGEVLVNELNTIPGFTPDERLRAAVRGVRHPVRRTAAAPRRPRGRAFRAPQRAALLGRGDARDARRLETVAEPGDPDDPVAVLRGRVDRKRRAWPRTCCEPDTVSGNGPDGESPARISAVKPGVGVVRVSRWSVTGRCASSTSPTPALSRLGAS